MIAIAVTMTAGIVIYWQAYRHFRSRTFYLLLMAIVPLGVAGATSCIIARPQAEAVSDLCLAFTGVMFLTASLQLKDAFRQAVDDDD